MAGQRAPAPGSPPPRRTQEQRREETRGAILDATVGCLAERGYSQTTTTRIARRAKVSRGALLHYYPAKEQLLASTIEHLFRRRTEEFRRAFAALPKGSDRRAATIEILWSMFSGPTFSAWLELAVASRNDAKLQPEVSRITREFSDTVQKTFREFFPAPADPSPFFELAPSFTFALLEGLALERITLDDPEHLAELLDLLKNLSTVVLGSGTPVPSERSLS